MKICIISDTHNHPLGKIGIPDCDLLIISGDLTGMGEEVEVKSVNYDLKQIKHKFDKAIVIAGNHDWLFEQNLPLAKALLLDGLDDKVIYLQNESTTYKGLNIYGSPVTPYFYGWAFNVQRGPDIAKVWAKIPDDTNILVTHGPPFDILDYTVDGRYVGCEELRLKVDKLKHLKLHAFGHIHFAYGHWHKNGLHFVNGSSVDEKYRQVNPPIVIDL